ncbi:phosphotransferase [Helcobacillus sp. ACRRO]|uniref:phosphotransferase family protein n=1 Tax=Helcobacillus sp. ACRRO TaxID=2918202 RepID=UPI001EF4E9BF|nr:phosphotransferase [Helcobacillus sp. ACRRO]
MAALPDPTSPALGERLAEAWADGSLIPVGPAPAAELPASEHPAPKLPPAERVRADLVGTGESYAAWRLSAPGTDPVTVRVPLTDAAVGLEFPALRLVQEHAPQAGPAPLAAHPDGATSPIGVPCAVTGFVPGEVLSPQGWTPAHLAAHARLLARLHTIALPGRGALPVLAPGPFSLEAEAASVFAWWEEHHPEALALPGDPAGSAGADGTRRILDRALAFCSRIDRDAGLTSDFVLSHGDLCATNVVWSHSEHPSPERDRTAAPGTPVPGFIDFEWAQADDRARDLAIIGGAVHGGPWYVPMDDAAVRAFVAEYVRESESLTDAAAPLDADHLLLRRDGWVAYERTAMLLHCSARASVGNELHRRVLPGLRERLSAFLAG